jgi:dsRNA-specific ribonuclease
LVLRHQKSENDDLSPSDRIYKLLPALFDVASGQWKIDWTLARSIVDFCPTHAPTFYDSLNDPHVLSSACSLMTPYNGLKYDFVRLRYDMSPQTEMDKESADAIAQSFQTYFLNQQGLEIKDGNQPLVEVIHAPAVKNLVIPPRRVNAAREQSDLRKKQPLYLIPELVVVLPFDQAFFRLATLVPTVLAKLERLLITHDFRTLIQANDKIDIIPLYTALCTPSASELVHNDRLETLGDSFLKYVVSVSLYIGYSDSDEGALTSMRSAMVSNRRLLQVGCGINIGGFLFASPFFPKQWAPPGLLSWRPVTRRSTVVGKADVEWLSDKMVADAVEALIGIFVIQCGTDAAFEMMKTIGVVKPDAVLRIDEPVELDMENAVNRYAGNIGNQHIRFDSAEDGVPPRVNQHTRFSADDGTETEDGEVVDYEMDDSYPPEPEHPTTVINDAVDPATAAAIEHVESILKYTFRDRSLISNALTHNSRASHPSESYQRLELLGDAALDWCITRHLYDAFPQLPPVMSIFLFGVDNRGD